MRILHKVNHTLSAPNLRQKYKSMIGALTTSTLTISSLVIGGLIMSGCSNDASGSAANLASADAPKTQVADDAAAARVTLQDVIAHPRRADETARDAYRHPKATLEFFEVGPNKAVAEIWPGWYTNVIAPYLAANGGTYTAVLLPETVGTRIVERNKAYKEKYSDKSVYGDIQYGTYFSNIDDMVAPNSQDIVLTFRNVHNWLARDYGDHAFETFYKALKPGGILGVVEHRLPESATQDPKAKSGYVQESFMKDMAARAGFEFIGSSEINANPKDDAEHPFGVWTLPPRMRPPENGSIEGEVYNPQIYRDIGESDRATLKFRKPL